MSEDLPTIAELREAYGLSTPEIAEMCLVSVDSVRAWLRPPENKAHREAPRMARELLRLKCADRKKKRKKRT